ncbi:MULTISPECIES: hypothetical protein [Paraburkholderia]|uniref:Uncharacterized protein n=1 Tax=Paraburkholderia madseniana TaxID=2599607 RepID=A0AAP5BB83_9BURK|nr:MULTISPECIES: hypothetical protein [Paraburkholderia]MCX4146520.1 hypothetical protein [Paraburkholderia madseniana]MDN7149466.1 hypothetical protein [Paraburkholderia sp. WS6]MDQ6408346.1 hypothetical protein [Paraburkholderia madseniana]
MDRHEFFAAMAHFHHAHATALPIEHLFGCLTQHLFGHGSRAGGEIKDAHREILEAGAKKRTDRAKIGEVSSREGSRCKICDAKLDNKSLTTRIGRHAIGNTRLATRVWQNLRAQKENGRLRVCANGHYRIVTANPPNPARHMACLAAASAMSAQPFDLLTQLAGLFSQLI